MKKLKKFYGSLAIGSLLLTGCIHNQPKLDSSWKKFSKSYQSSDYSMREEIDYFELRKYIVELKTNKLVSKKYIPYLPIYKKEFSSYSSKIISQFKQLPFDTTENTSIETTSTNNPEYRFKTKGFIIKDDKTFVKINEKKDFIWLFDGINTEAELYQFLIINKLFKNMKSYKQTASGYEVKQENIKHNGDTKTKGNCEIYSPYREHTTYIFKIKKNGQFSKELISTKRVNLETSKWCDGLHPSPPILPLFAPLALETILSDTRLVTP